MTTRAEDLVQLLERTWQRPVEIAGWQPLDPSWVVRVGVRVGTRRESLVVKWVRPDEPLHPGWRTHPGQILREHATLRFVTDVVGPIAPVPVACSADLLVMEDLAPRTTLHDVLLADPDEPALAGLEEMVDLLATLHAGTRHRQEAYAARLPDGWTTSRPTWSDPVGADGPARHHAPVALDVAGLGYRTGSAPRPDDDAAVELDDLTRRLVEPGEFHALSTGDAGPNNVLIAPELTARLIDAEFAGYQHALTDLLSLYLPHPAWVTAMDPVGAGLEQRYRDAMAPVAPVFADDVAFGWELAAAAVAYATDRLSRFERCDDRPAGDPSRLQLLITAETAASLLRDRSAYPAIAAWLADVGGALRRRWPETDLDVAALPPWLPRLDG